MKTSWDKSFNTFFFPAHLGLCLRASPLVSRPFGGGEEEEKEERRRGEKSVVFALGSSYKLFRSMTVAILGIEASLASPSPLPPHTMQGVRRLPVWNPRLRCALLLFYNSRIPDRNPRSFSCVFSNPRPYPEVVFMHPLRIRANPRIVLRRWLLLRRLQTQAIAVNPQQAAQMFQHPRPKASHNVFR